MFTFYSTGNTLKKGENTVWAKNPKHAWEAELGLWEASLQLLVCMVLGSFYALDKRVFLPHLFFLE